MKRILPVFILILIVPQIAMAAWWNPLGWGIFHRTENKTQVLENRIKELENKLGTTTSISTKTEKTNPDKSTEKQLVKPSATQVPPKNEPVIVTSPVSTTKSNITFCNGKNYSACPAGSALVCPSNGTNAVCSVIKTPVIDSSIKIEVSSDCAKARENYKNAQMNVDLEFRKKILEINDHYDLLIAQKEQAKLISHAGDEYWDRQIASLQKEKAERVRSLNPTNVYQIIKNNALQDIEAYCL